MHLNTKHGLFSVCNNEESLFYEQCGMYRKYGFIRFLIQIKH